MSHFNFSESSSFRRAEESPGFLLWRASTRWRRAIEAVLKTLDLTHPQFVILATIGWLTQKGQKVSQAHIGRHASLDPNTTSQILRSLQAKHLIERSRSEDDRSKHPILTPQGQALLKKALPAVEQADALFFASTNLNQWTALKALQTLAGLDV